MNSRTSLEIPECSDVSESVYTWRVTVHGGKSVLDLPRHIVGSANMVH